MMKWNFQTNYFINAIWCEWDAYETHGWRTMFFVLLKSCVEPMLLWCCTRWRNLGEPLTDRHCRKFHAPTAACLDQPPNLPARITGSAPIDYLFLLQPSFSMAVSASPPREDTRLSFRGWWVADGGRRWSGGAGIGSGTESGGKGVGLDWSVGGRRG